MFLGILELMLVPLVRDSQCKTFLIDGKSLRASSTKLVTEKHQWLK